MLRAGRAATSGVVLSAAAILLATLLPSFEKPASVTHAFAWTLTPGLADLLRNVFLFLPLGATLTLAGVSPGRALLGGIGFSCLVELIQLLVPGRLAGPFDVAANALGTGLGMLLVREHRLWLFPSSGQRRALCAVGMLMASLALAAPAVFFAPASTGLRVFGHRSPLPFKSLFPYRGTVLSASVNGHTLPHGPVADSEGVWERLLGDHRLMVELIAGEPPAGQAGFLMVSDIQRTGVLFLGPDHDDLEYQYLTRGRLLGLEPGAVRLRDALRNVHPGDTLSVRVEHIGPDICIEVDGKPHCGRGFGVGDGWRLVAPRFLARSRSAGFISFGWLALLWFPLGYWSIGRGPGLALAAAGSLVLLLAPGGLGLLPTPVVELLAPGAGVVLGRVAAGRLAGWAPGG